MSKGMEYKAGMGESVLKAQAERIAELEAFKAVAVAMQADRQELQRKYDALVDGITIAQSHTSETLRLLQWDQLGWDVPEEVIESLGKADSKLRPLLENDDD